MPSSSSSVLGPSVGPRFALLLRQLKTSRSSSDLSRLLMEVSSSHCWLLLHWRHLSVVWPASAGGPLISLAFGLATAVFRCGSGFTRGYGWSPVFPSFGRGGRRRLSTLDAFVHQPEFLSGQSWPLLDFPLCGILVGLCRSSLAAPSRCQLEYAPSFHQLVSPRCGCV